MQLKVNAALTVDRQHNTLANMQTIAERQIYNDLKEHSWPVAVNEPDPFGSCWRITNLDWGHSQNILNAGPFCC